MVNSWKVTWVENGKSRGSLAPLWHMQEGGCSLTSRLYGHEPCLRALFPHARNSAVGTAQPLLGPLSLCLILDNPDCQMHGGTVPFPKSFTPTRTFATCPTDPFFLNMLSPSWSIKKDIYNPAPMRVLTHIQNVCVISPSSRRLFLSSVAQRALKASKSWKPLKCPRVKCR